MPVGGGLLVHVATGALLQVASGVYESRVGSWVGARVRLGGVAGWHHGAGRPCVLLQSHVRHIGSIALDGVRGQCQGQQRAGESTSGPHRPWPDPHLGCWQAVRRAGGHLVHGRLGQHPLTLLKGERRPSQPGAMPSAISVPDSPGRHILVKVPSVSSVLGPSNAPLPEGPPYCPSHYLCLELLAEALSLGHRRLLLSVHGGLVRRRLQAHDTRHGGGQHPRVRGPRRQLLHR